MKLDLQEVALRSSYGTFINTCTYSSNVDPVYGGNIYLEITCITRMFINVS